MLIVNKLSICCVCYCTLTDTDSVIACVIGCSVPVTTANTSDNSIALGFLCLHLAQTCCYLLLNVLNYESDVLAWDSHGWREAWRPLPQVTRQWRRCQGNFLAVHCFYIRTRCTVWAAPWNVKLLVKFYLSRWYNPRFLLSVFLRYY